MGDIGKQALKTKIDSKVYENTSQAISGANMNEILQDTVDTLCDGGNLDAGTVTKSKLASGVTDNLDWAVASNSYYRNSQAGNVAAKEITTYKNMSLMGGGSLKVTFEQVNTANDATLNIDGTGAKPLYYNGARVSSTNSWEANETVEIYYNNYNSGAYHAKRWMVEPVSVSQNSQTGHTEIHIGDNDYPVPSLSDIYAKGIVPIDFSIIGGISGSDGSDSSNNDFKRTDYVKVSQGLKLIYDVQEGSAGWCAIACYDSNGDYMSSASVKGTSSGTFIIPSGVAKIRLSSLVDYTNTYAKFQFVSEYTEDYPNVTTSKITDKAVTYPKLGDDVNAYLNRLLELNLDGGVAYSNGAISTGTATKHKMTGFIKVIEGEKINYDLLGNSTGWAVVAAYSASFEYVKTSSIAGNASVTTPTIGQYVVPNGVAYIVLSGASNYTNTISFDTFETSRVLGIVNEKISEFDGYLIFKNIGGINADGTDSSNNDFKRTDLIPVNTGDIIKASVQEGSAGWCAIACYDSSQVFVSDETILGTGQVQNILKTIPDGVSYIKISTLISYSGGYAIKNRVVRENDLETDAELTRVNTVSVMKYTNILQQRGCIAIQMDLGYLDNARSGCDSMIEVMREYGLMSMDYAINITALQDTEIDKLLGRQKEGCEIIYHNRINSPSDFSNNSTLTVAELKEGVLDERLAMTQKGFTTFGVVASVGSLATRYKPTIDNIFFWSEYGSADIMTSGAENSKAQYLTDHRIIRTSFEINHTDYTPELEAEMIVKGKAWIDDLCTNKTFGVMYCHFYDRPNTDYYHLYEGVLRAMCEYIAEKISDGELWFGATTECLNYLCR